MRKITEEAIEAFNYNEDFKKSNTQVMTGGRQTELYLFGNLIAIKNIRTGELSITNCGYQTVTTKERLNGLRGVSIRQKQGVWYLNGKEWNGSWVNMSEWEQQ